MNEMLVWLSVGGLVTSCATEPLPEIDPSPVLADLVEQLPVDRFCSEYGGDVADGLCPVGLEGEPLPVATGEDVRVLAFAMDDEEQVLFTRHPEAYDLAMGDKLADYYARVEEYYGRPEMTPEERRQDQLDAAKEAELEEPEEDGDVVLFPEHRGCDDSDRVYDGITGCKLIYGSDSRILQNNPRSYPQSKFVYFAHDGYDEGGPTTVCSGAFLDADYVLTAGHCVYDTIDNHYIFANRSTTNPPNVDTPDGLDEGLGYVCLSGQHEPGSDFRTYCEFVDVMYTMADWRAATTFDTNAAKHDAALLKLRRDNHPSGLGSGRWIALSAIDSTSTLESKVAVEHGYPKARPGLTYNHLQTGVFGVTGSYGGVWETRDWRIMGADQYRTSGDVIGPTTSSLLRHKTESGGGQSGSATFYYTNDATTYSGQGHYVIGVRSGSEANHSHSITNKERGVGPTVKQYRSWAVGIVP